MPLVLAGWIALTPMKTTLPFDIVNKAIVYFTQDNEQDTEETTVIFRKWPDGEVDALMPELPADYNGNITAYAHIGQHSAADYQWVISQTVPAKPEEYEELKKELEDIGYKVKVRQKYIPKRK